MKKLVIGNWKMTLLRRDAVELATRLAVMDGFASENAARVVICPPAIWLCDVAAIIEKTPLALGAQDVSPVDSGPCTGDVSATMLADAGVTYVLVGHSERRGNHNEDNALVRAKALAAQKKGLVPVICIGESAQDRADNRQQEIVAAQLAGSVPESGPYILAYEPVWAIGTGKTATLDDISAMHAFIRGWLVPNRSGGQGEDTSLAPAGGKTVDPQAQACILYGGSVKTDNAKGILSLPDVGGVLVGGASLDADAFQAIACAVQ